MKNNIIPTKEEIKAFKQKTLAKIEADEKEVLIEVEKEIKQHLLNEEECFSINNPIHEHGIRQESFNYVINELKENGYYVSEGDDDRIIIRSKNAQIGYIKSQFLIGFSLLMLIAMLASVAWLALKV